MIYKLPMGGRALPSTITWNGRKDTSDNIVLLYAGGTWQQIDTVKNSSNAIHTWNITPEQISGMLGDYVYIAFFAIKNGSYAGIYNATTSPIIMNPMEESAYTQISYQSSSGTVTVPTNALKLRVRVNTTTKGDALLQKSYTVDFLTKEKMVNEGEIPQYYVKGNHEAIIQPEVFDMVQNMMAMRKTGKNRISSINAFSSKIRCGDCGGWYGSKVWHSNTKYRRRVWRCNHKYENDDKCQTPHLTDDEVKEIFVNSTNQLIEIKEEVIRNFEEARELLFGTAELEQEQEELEDTLNQLADEINALINENARIALDQTKYERNYSKLVKKFDEAEARLATVKEKIALRQGKQEQVEMILKELENTDLVEEFDESLFNRLVEVIDVEKEKITVTFKDGSEVTI